MVKLGIIGLGFVGGSMLKSFLNKNLNVLGYDKYKNEGVNNINMLLDCDIIFLALPTKFNESTLTYDISEIENTLNFLVKNNCNSLIVIKSTLVPGTCENISSVYNQLNIIHNPEFLSAKTAYEDFNNQKHIVLGKTNNCSNLKYIELKNFYLENYKSEISECSSVESETMKCFANSFYSVKIQFFTEMYLTCQKNNCSYENVKNMILKNGWVNPMHTNVPGSDGKISYGGLCFPKDTKALSNYMKKNNIPNNVLDASIKERDQMRDDKSNII